MSFLEQLSFTRVPFLGGQTSEEQVGANGESLGNAASRSVTNGSAKNGHTTNGNPLCETQSAEESGAEEQCDSDTNENDDSDSNGNRHSRRCQFSDGRSRRDDSQAGSINSFALTNQDVAECKVWRNPFALFRGAEYYRFERACKRTALTYYDMQLSAQDHQTLFLTDCDTPNGEKGVRNGSPPASRSNEQELLLAAYRERSPAERVRKARESLSQNSDYVPALVFLAEEEPTLISDSERQLRHALKLAETNYRKSASMQHYGGFYEAQHSKYTVLLFQVLDYPVSFPLLRCLLWRQFISRLTFLAVTLQVFIVSTLLQNN